MTIVAGVLVVYGILLALVFLGHLLGWFEVRPLRRIADRLDVLEGRVGVIEARRPDPRPQPAAPRSRAPFLSRSGRSVR